MKAENWADLDLQIGLKCGVDLTGITYMSRRLVQPILEAPYRRQAFPFHFHFHSHSHMKTSRIARDGAKVAISFSPADYVPRRQTRAFAASLQAFTANGGITLPSPEKKAVKREDTSDDDSLSSSASVFDIEDVPFQSSTSRKRKRGLDSPSTTVTTKSTSTSVRTSPRKPGMTSEDGTVGRVKKTKRQPAKRIVNDAGEVEIEAPVNWEEVYDAVREMRKEKLAPVDTMGCETLAEEHLKPRVS